MWVVYFLRILHDLFQGPYYSITAVLSSYLEFMRDFSLLSLLESIAFLAIIAASIIIVIIAYRGIKILTDAIGDYQKRDPSKESKLKRIVKMMLLYLISTFPAYIAVLSIIQLPPNPQPFQISIIFPFSISLIISLRIFTNPTAQIREWFYPNDPYGMGLKEIHDYVKSFYFSLILGGVIVFIGDFIIGNNRLSDNFTILWNVPYLIPLMTIAYFVSLLVLAYISEICFLENGKFICL